MIVDCALYEHGKRRPGELALSDAFEAAHAPDAFVWIGLHEPTVDEFEAVRAEFGLHELAVEDAVTAHQRPKLETYGDSLFVVLKPARYDDEQESVVIGELMLFVGERFAVSVRHGEASALAECRNQLESQPDLLREGPGAVLYAVLDWVVDDYMPVAEGLDNDIQEVEETVFAPEAGNATERIYKLKREALEFHRATASLVDPLDRLARGQVPLVPEALGHYFRDVHDHLLRVFEQADGFRDLLTSVLEANLAQVAVRQNEDMRKISAWVAIAAVPTAIAGVYGMNFDFMPELHWRFGYPFALLLMAGCCGLLYRAFRRSGWL